MGFTITQRSTQPNAHTFFWGKELTFTTGNFLFKNYLVRHGVDHATLNISSFQSQSINTLKLLQVCFGFLRYREITPILKVWKRDYEASLNIWASLLHYLTLKSWAIMATIVNTLSNSMPKFDSNPLSSVMFIYIVDHLSSSHSLCSIYTL